MHKPRKVEFSQTTFHSRQKWKVSVHRVISSVPSDTRGFYMIQNAYENSPWSILSSSTVSLDSDFPDTGTWYTDFHLSAFSVIIYGLMLQKHWRKCIALITSGDFKGTASISSATTAQVTNLLILEKAHHALERQQSYQNACRNSVQPPPLLSSCSVCEDAVHKGRCCQSFVWLFKYLSSFILK